MATHPRHMVTVRAPAGPEEPARPMEATDLLLRWRRRRDCRKAGGHWWHPDPDDPIVGWFCCQCGKRTEGSPRDGSRG